MGTYIYAIQSPNHLRKARLDTGETVTVIGYRFAYKVWPDMGNRPESRAQTAARSRIERVRKLWEEFAASGGQWPDAGVILHGDDEAAKGIAADAPVLRWEGRQRVPILLADDDWNGGQPSGRVQEVVPLNR